MVAIVEVHAVVVRCVFDHLKGEADTLRLARDHVVRALKVVEKLVLAVKDLHLVNWDEGYRSDLKYFFRQRLVVIVDSFLNIVLMIDHDYKRAGLVRVGPRSLADALVRHPV